MRLISPTLVPAVAVAALFISGCLGGPMPLPLAPLEAHSLIRGHLLRSHADLNPEARLPVRELTPPGAWEYLSMQVFEVTKGAREGASFALHRGRVIPLGNTFGGFGLTSIVVDDLDHDGMHELIYTYTSLQHSYVAAVARGDDGFAESVAPISFAHSDLYLHQEDDGVLVQIGVFDYQTGEFSGRMPFGRVHLAEGAVQVTLEDNLPESITANISG